MSRKHFEIIAATLANAPINNGQRAQIALEFAMRLARENERFDRARFLKACGCA